MTLSHYPHRLLLTTLLFSVLLLALCGTLAVWLSRQQSRTAEILGENIGSRRAAAKLEETLIELILHQRGSRDLEALQERAEDHLREINLFADKTEERRLVKQLTVGFRDYQEKWTAGQSATALEDLQLRALPACQELRNFNARQIEESESEHQQALQRMTWGLAVVGALGSLGGIVLGFGLSRGLRRTIHQLLIRVSGASELLSQELPPVEWNRAERDPLQDQTPALLQQVEQVVRKLQQKEGEVRRAERLAAVGQLAAGVAHEIRNPLTSIKLLIQTSRRDPAAGALSEEDLDLIESEILRLERSVQTFLDFARPAKLERASCNLTTLMRHTLGLVRGRATQQKVLLQFTEPAVPVIIEADTSQLQQVVVNLLLNALDAMPHGGRVELSVIGGPADLVELTVRDSGSGIPTNMVPRLFEPFATSKETGLGLGLVVSQRIVQDHGGTIHGYNPPEGGACFVVCLPTQGVKSS